MDIVVFAVEAEARHLDQPCKTALGRFVEDDQLETRVVEEGIVADLITIQNTS